MTLRERARRAKAIAVGIPTLIAAGAKVWGWKRTQVKSDHCAVCGHELEVGALIGHSDDGSVVVHLRCLRGGPHGRTDS